MIGFRSINPATEICEASYPEDTLETLQSKLGECAHAQAHWRAIPIRERGIILRRVADLLEERKEVLALVMAAEMGKPLYQGRSEAQKCASVCRYYADNAQAMLTPEMVPSDADQSGVRYDPLGTILAIMPWNFPLWQVCRFGAPALMAGNSVALKHAPNVQRCALALIDAFEDAGLPTGLLVNLRASHTHIPHLIADNSVAAVTFTGSTRAGSAVAALAGQHLKKSVLELGGSDAFVVLADADIELAAKVGCGSRLLNSGQSCIAAKRFIVEEAIAESFIARFEQELDQAVVGDPTDPRTTVGPLAREDLRQVLHQQVCQSVAAGATLRRGGQIPCRTGWFYPLTLLTNVSPSMAVWNEEVFGPVASIRVVNDASAALAAANDTPFGLGAAVFTRNLKTAETWCREIETGAVFINGMVKSDPRLPFGGIRRSGYGRELGQLGIREFVNQKTFWINTNS